VLRWRFKIVHRIDKITTYCNPQDCPNRRLVFYTKSSMTRVGVEYRISISIPSSWSFRQNSLMLMELNLSYCYHRATCQLPLAQHKVVFLCAISRPPSILQNLSPTNMVICLQFRSLTSNLTATTIQSPGLPLNPKPRIRRWYWCFRLLLSYCKGLEKMNQKVPCCSGVPNNNKMNDQNRTMMITKIFKCMHKILYLLR
jgi:hypothetical protein